MTVRRWPGGEGFIKVILGEDSGSYKLESAFPRQDPPRPSGFTKKEWAAAWDRIMEGDYTIKDGIEIIPN